MDELLQTAESGDRLETLKALRQKVADAISRSKSGRDIAALSRQLQIIMIEIESIEEKNASSDEISAILAERKAAGKPGAIRKNGATIYTFTTETNKSEKERNKG